MKNLLNNEECASKAQRIVDLYNEATKQDALLMITMSRYAVAGKIKCITEDYLEYAPGDCIEIGSTGKLGGMPTEFEINPWPKFITINSIEFVEFIKKPVSADEQLALCRQQPSKRK